MQTALHAALVRAGICRSATMRRAPEHLAELEHSEQLYLVTCDDMLEYPLFIGDIFTHV